jgi:polysaccharide biosynthesis protein PslH
VFIAPLRVARGVQSKVLEALAMGRRALPPSSPGVAPSCPEDDGILVADTAAEFAELVVRLLRTLTLRAAVARKARAAAETQYRREDRWRRSTRSSPA